MLDPVPAQFLFLHGDTAYLRAETTLGPQDSVAAPGYGRVLDATAPLWLVSIASTFAPPTMGATVVFEHFRLPRRAANLVLACDADIWDPVWLHSGSAYAAAGLVQRTLFLRTESDSLQGDLATGFEWRGHDLFVTIDTTARFGDGTPIDAFAVKASLERMLWYRRNRTVYAWDQVIAGVDTYRQGRVNQVVGLIPRSRDTLQFNLTRSMYELPDRLAALSTAIVRWTVQANRSPVVTTAGYYGVQRGDTLAGRLPHDGALRLTPADTEYVADLGDSTGAGGREIMLPMPRLVVIRPRGVMQPAIMSFLQYALDREAIASVTCGGCAQFPERLYPMGELQSESGAAHGVDFEAARAARELIAGSPSLRIAGAPGLEAAVDYVVTALKAWNLKATQATASGAYDLRIETWDFDDFSSDAIAETIFDRLGFRQDDSLVRLLDVARATPDPKLRTDTYRSLLARIEELSPYVVLYQPAARLRVMDPLLELSFDPSRRPVGPIFRREEEH